MTIDLGFAWTDAAVRARRSRSSTCPGHERFVTTMLAGVGPVPAVLLVVAADEGWMPQSAEHLDALDALGVRHGLLVVTRSDLAEPELAPRRGARAAGRHLAGRRCRPSCVSAADRRRACDELRAALDELVAGAARARPDAPTCGCGSTGRSPSAARARWSPARSARAGSGWTTSWSCYGRPARAGSACAGCRASGEPRDRGRAAWPGWRSTCAGVPREAVDPRRRAAHPGRLARHRRCSTCGCTASRGTAPTPTRCPSELMLHVGVGGRRRSGCGRSAATPSGCGCGTPLPLRIGDRAVLRDPGRRRGRGRADRARRRARRRCAAAAPPPARRPSWRT